MDESDAAATTPDEWVMDLAERRLWLSLLAVTSGLVPRLDDHHREHFDISHHEYTALIMIAESDNATAELSSVARRTNASLSRISHTVRRLARDGLVVLARSDRDGRATTATLTDAGAELLERAARGAMAEAQRLVFDPLTKEQQDALTQICLTLLSSWRPDDPHPWVR